jgi:phage tail protein X
MKTVLSVQGESLDALSYRIFGSSAQTENLIRINPDLLNFGPVLPAGTAVNVPEAVQQPGAAVKVKSINLWE